MNLGRTLRHLFTGKRAARRAFPERVLDAIEAAVRDAERSHHGQIRVAIEASLYGPQLFIDLPARARALEVFSRLGVWDTEHNNGVLIYILLADRDVEIVADRGIHSRCGPEAWEAVCRAMEEHFRHGRFEAGVIEGVHRVGALLAEHFPRRGEQANEQSDRPVLI
jgi:uncharacterized membrane protein YgcG